MPIPPQNDFLRPFLTILSDGQSYKRSQMIYRLAKHFGISEAEAQHMSGQQFTLVNRVAWCDVYFVKAHFVEKQQHTADSMDDTFRITSRGVRELGQHPDQLTVRYLQSFYRSRIHRGAGSDDSISDAELKLYEQFEALTDEFEIFHSVRWFAKSKGTLGEADFLIVHPQRGILVLEVKGGGISMEAGQWYSTDRDGRRRAINDPCQQAERNRFALRDWLAEDPRTKNLLFSMFPAVALPDARVDRDIRPDCPQDIFIDMRHIDELRPRLHAIFAYWQSRAHFGNKQMDGYAAVEALIALLEPTHQLQPTIRDIFKRERRQIDELTQRQLMVLRLLRQLKRAAIVGGAGTGKTLLAMEKAQQLLDAGYRVLFLCFNKNLNQWLERRMHHPNLMIETFHSFVSYAKKWTNLHGSPGRFYEEAPNLLMDAAQILQAQQSEYLFDAIIVDEAQDFEDTWWIPLPDLLKDPQHGVFYVFFDDNQRIFQQISNIPMQGEPLFLSDNCRNTQHIHARMTGYMISQYETECRGPEGRPIEVISASTFTEAKRALQQILHRLVNKEGLHSDDIILLTGASQERSQWQEDEQVGNFVLTWELNTEIPQAIRVCSVFKFKGLESAVVILSELDKAREEVRKQVSYVGLSRAQHHVIVIGALPIV